jgi:multiple sugar transport system substrate-binding protein
MFDRKLTRREALRAFGLSAAGVALAACAAPMPAAPQVIEKVVTPTPAPPQEVTLRAASWDIASAQPIENKVLAGFKEKFPHITVKLEFNTDAYADKLLTSMAAGNAPDVFMWWNFPMLVARGGIEDLTPYLEGPSGLDISIYYKEVLDYNRVGPGLYGLPKDFTPRAIYYNKALFDAAGIAYPTNDWTWDDLLVMAKAMTKGEGAEAQYGFSTYTDTYPIQYYVWSHDGDMISPDGKQASGYCDSQATIEAITWYVDLAIKEKVSPSPTAVQSLGGESQMFMTGKLAIFDTGRWPLTDFRKAEGLQFATILPPLDPKTKKRVTVLHEAGWCLSAASKYKFNEAWELTKWMGGPEANKIRAEAGWALPAIPSVVKELNMESDPLEKPWFDAVPFATVKPWFMRTPVWWPADREFHTAFEAAFLEKATVEEALKEVAPRVDQILSTL